MTKFVDPRTFITLCFFLTLGGILVQVIAYGFAAFKAVHILNSDSAEFDRDVVSTLPKGLKLLAFFKKPKEEPKVEVEKQEIPEYHAPKKPRQNKVSFKVYTEAQANEIIKKYKG